MTVSTEFGALLRSARLSRALSIAELAADAGVSESFLRRVEKGEAQPKLMVLARLWRLLRFDGNALVDALGESVEAPDKREKRAIVSLVADHLGPFAAFGRALTLARIDAQLTQSAVAHAVGCQRRQITRMEGGRALPSLRRFAQLRALLGFDADELLARLDSDPPQEPFSAFGQILAAARAEHELSRTDVARSVGCEEGYVKDVERGAELPTVLTLARIHKVLSFPGDHALQAVCLGDERQAA